MIVYHYCLLLLPAPTSLVQCDIRGFPPCGEIGHPLAEISPCALHTLQFTLHTLHCSLSCTLHRLYQNSIPYSFHWRHLFTVCTLRGGRINTTRKWKVPTMSWSQPNPSNTSQWVSPSFGIKSTDFCTRSISQNSLNTYWFQLGREQKWTSRSLQQVFKRLANM